MTGEAGDPLPTREGISAGGLVTVAFFLVLFVSPWQEFAIRSSSEGLPVDVVGVDGGGTGLWLAAACAGLIGFVTCVNYLDGVDDPPEGFRSRLIGATMLVPISLALAGVVALVIWSLTQVSSEAPGVVAAMMVGSMAWSMFSMFVAIFVGAPAAAGVWVGEKVA